jgi:hypothetical protein
MCWTRLDSTFPGGLKIVQSPDRPSDAGAASGHGPLPIDARGQATRSRDRSADRIKPLRVGSFEPLPRAPSGLRPPEHKTESWEGTHSSLWLKGIDTMRSVLH